MPVDDRLALGARELGKVGGGVTSTEDKAMEDDNRRGLGGLVAAVLVLLVLVSGVLFAVQYFSDPSSGGALADVQTSFNRGLFAKTLDAADRAWATEPSNEVVVLAAESAQKLNKSDVALRWYRRLSDDGSSEYGIGVAAHAAMCSQLGRLSESEQLFKKALQLDPESVDLNRQLATLLTSEGRRWEASRHFFTALRSDALQEVGSIDDMLMLANFEAPFEDQATIQKSVRAVPDDPLPELGRVHTRYVFNKFDEGIDVCRSIIDHNPQQVQAHVWLGRGLIGAGAIDQLPEWEAALPANADDFPGIWHIRGSWAARNNQSTAAARCFWEAVQREPNYIAANFQLGLTLVDLKRPEDAQPFLDRNALLADYHQITHPMYSEGPRTDSLLKLIELSEKLNRPWEQLLWARFLIEHSQRQNDQKGQQTGEEVYQRLATSLSTNLPPRTTASPAAALDLSDYPLPDWSRAKSILQTSTDSSSSPIRFEDIAANVGVDFTYFNSAERRTKGIRIFETTGGGVASLDYDLDGWSDLYFTQGSVWPVDRKNDQQRDKLFRNRLGESVVDVTALAGLGDANYSQGVTFGDMNHDGFPDLYIGNIGENRLFQNNGDGTFTEISNGIDVNPPVWTTSVVMADFNNDGLADLFDVNYLAGQDIFDRLCGAEVQRVCAPSAFAGEQDNVFLNNGDGTFTNATQQTGLGEVQGKGLGVVAADFDGTGRLGLFVANDGIANHYFVCEGEGNEFQLLERGRDRGIALDYDARGQACMGVAAGDYDGNQKLDLFVTNYYDDSNTLYAMLSAGSLFEDRTREAQLRTPSFHFLGFGTQFLDADLDGWPDLVLTNGHVDDFSHENTPFRMRPQFYRNRGDSQFAEVIPPTDAKYMNQDQLGRGLARFDFDRDGRFDFAVSHLDTPAALARNMTTDTGHYLTVRLVGTASARDSIGALVTARTGERTTTMHLTAGDGYQAANERSLNFGLGSAETIDELTVKWPSGQQQGFRNVAVDQELTIREGSNRPLVVPQ